MRSRGKDVVRDALHVVARVENDRAARRVNAHPFHVAAIEDLQPLDLRRREEREHVDVFMSEEARVAAGIVFGGDGVAEVEARVEVRAGELDRKSTRLN